MVDTHARSILKGMTWRLIATSTTMLLVFLYTGDVTLVAHVGALDITLKLLFYYVHERAWGRVAWGKVCVACASAVRVRRVAGGKPRARR